MGVEYAIVCDKTGEAYDLGKGFWGDWKKRGRGPKTYFDDVDEGFPESREHVRETLDRWDWATEPERIAITDSIWAFIESHPGCHVVDDCGDNFWHKPDHERDEILRQGGSRVYREVGDRYSPVLTSRPHTSVAAMKQKRNDR